MTSRSRKKLILYIFIFTIIFIGYFLVIKTFEENIIYFVTPKELQSKSLTGKEIRIGGLVKPGSSTCDKDLNWIFIITDNVAEVKVQYHGILPNLFRDGQGVIAKGEMQGDEFIANEILAKHDEKYIPKSIAQDLQKKGYWRK